MIYLALIVFSIMTYVMFGALACAVLTSYSIIGLVVYMRDEIIKIKEGK